jgi:hypothetical protein
MHKLDCYPEAPGHHVRRLEHAGVAESREILPKQFIPLVGERSTFQTTIAMLADPSRRRSSSPMRTIAFSS